MWWACGNETFMEVARIVPSDITNQGVLVNQLLHTCRYDLQDAALVRSLTLAHVHPVDPQGRFTEKFGCRNLLRRCLTHFRPIGALLVVETSLDHHVGMLSNVQGQEQVVATSQKKEDHGLAAKDVDGLTAQCIPCFKEAVLQDVREFRFPRQLQTQRTGQQVQDGHISVVQRQLNVLPLLYLPRDAFCKADAHTVLAQKGSQLLHIEPDVTPQHNEIQDLRREERDQSRAVEQAKDQQCRCEESLAAVDRNDLIGTQRELGQGPMECRAVSVKVARVHKADTTNRVRVWPSQPCICVGLAPDEEEGASQDVAYQDGRHGDLYDLQSHMSFLSLHHLLHPCSYSAQASNPQCLQDPHDSGSFEHKPTSAAQNDVEGRHQ
mmetsp:Transcript_11848/g.26941  ORF Transcript_11848/g.26941 Transcript_11848/m.26941 type:complete len:379 (+) Transcript_11848:946-2082(+)